jgi:hypothetical protein
MTDDFDSEFVGMPTARGAPSLAIWKLKIRDRFSMREVMIAAHDLDTAVRVGQRWCEKNSTANAPIRFLSVVPLVEADESILE